MNRNKKIFNGIILFTIYFLSIIYKYNHDVKLEKYISKFNEVKIVYSQGFKKKDYKITNTLEVTKFYDYLCKQKVNRTFWKCVDGNIKKYHISFKNDKDKINELVIFENGKILINYIEYDLNKDIFNNVEFQNIVSGKEI